MDSRCTRLLGKSCDQLLDLLPGNHHQIGQFVDDNDNMRHRNQRFRRLRRQREGICQLLPGLLGILDAVIKAGDIAHTHRRHQLVTLLHLGHTPVKRVGGVLHVNNHWRQQMRNAFIDRQLKHFRINENQPDLIGFRLVEQRKNHRVDADRLSRTGRPRHQQVRHLGQVDDHRVTANILAKRHRQRRRHIVVFVARNNFRESNDLPFGVGQFERHAGFPRHRLDDANRDHRQRPRHILGQIDDLRALHADGRLDFVTRNHWAWIRSQNLHLHAKISQLALDQARSIFKCFRTDSISLR